MRRWFSLSFGHVLFVHFLVRSKTALPSTKNPAQLLVFFALCGVGFFSHSVMYFLYTSSFVQKSPCLAQKILRNVLGGGVDYQRFLFVSSFSCLFLVLGSFLGVRFGLGGVVFLGLWLLFGGFFLL